MSSAAPPAPPPEPAQPATKTSITGLFTVFQGGLGLLWVLIGFLPTIIFSWGAAKLNWSVNQSWGWATLAFFFSGLYYPYFAFFHTPAPSIMSAITGARRRR